MFLATVLAGFLGAAGVAAKACPAPALPTECNGNAAFCSRRYSNVSFVGTHDSAFVGNMSDPRINQEESVTDQLNAGIRFLQAQTHVINATLSMCHTSCAELYAGPLNTYLSTVKSWLDANPNEVLTMLLVNGDNVDVTQFGAVFTAVGLADSAFIPSTTPDTLDIGCWPTYQQLLDAGTRIVVFLDSNADETAVPYILTEFNYFFETPYDTTDPSFPECTLDRPANSSADGKMYIVNHFLDKELIPGIDIPDNDADFTTNAATGNGSIGAQADLCTSTYGRVPNFVLVDMFDRGNVFTAQDALNGV